MRGDELIGVIIAGSEEDPNHPVGYAISADEVYRNISTSMGGLPVRPLTATENDILALEARSGDSQLDRLAALHVRLLFSATAHVGSIQSTLSQALPGISDIQTSDAKLTAFLKLGRFCSSLHSRLLTSPQSLFEFESNPPRSQMPAEKGLNVIHQLFRRPNEHNAPAERRGAAMYRELRQYKEGTDVILLTVALLGTWRAPDVALILSDIMAELNIFPLPTLDHIGALVDNVHHETRSLPSPGYRDPTMMYRSFHAKSLARILCALHKSCFFVQTSIFAIELAEWVLAHYHNPVLFVTRHMNIVDTARLEPASMDPSWSFAGVMRLPRIFLAEPGVKIDGKDVRFGLNAPHGEVVEYGRLNELLMDLKAKSELSEHRSNAI
jgi:hypothetical protein